MSSSPDGPVRPEDVVPTDPVLRLAKRVVGEPIEHDGVLVVPLSAVRGGSGGGSGSSAGGERGQGGGWGATARPVGAFVVADGRVRYQPAIDLARVLLAVPVVAVVAYLTLRRCFSTRR